MKVVWRLGSCTAPDVIVVLAPETGWNPATIKTLLNRLLQKRALRFEKRGKAYVYSAAVTAEELQGAESESFLARVFDGALSPMLAHFVQSRRLTQKEFDALEKVLRDGRKSR